MKRIVAIAALALLSSLAAHGQNIHRFTTQLSYPDPTHGSRITVVPHGSAGSITGGKSLSKEAKINGYRVRIFSDNSQSARDQATKTKSEFEELFPTIPTYIDYTAPYWSVTVGNCADIDEALILFGRVKESFNKAFQVRTEIPITELLK